MTTAELLGAMTDPGLFERLATSILRIADEECKAVIHCGVNAEGQPINAPVDGFLLVPGRHPGRFILLAHTIEDPEGLKRKWLGHQGHAGDLTKAAQFAEDVRSRFPDAIFRIILSTNQRLKPGLTIEVAATADKLGFECDIWEQSSLADFLDTRSEGHWIRKQYLGVEAELLSGSLLGDLSSLSLSRYAADFLLTPSETWVERSEEETLDCLIDEMGPAILFLKGSSGTGKSVAAYRVMARHMAKGGSALWFPADRILGCTTLKTAVSTVLADLHPFLAPASGEQALNLVQTGLPLLIVIDDANRLQHPLGLIRKVCTWLNRQPVDPQNGSPRPIENVRILCPVWPRLWSVLPTEVRDQEAIRLLDFGEMSREETVASLKKGLVPTQEQQNIEEVADFLHNDPILVGLFIAMIRRNSTGDILSLAHRVMDSFIERHMLEALPSVPLSESLSVLTTLAYQMLLRRELNPVWMQVVQWAEFNEHERLLLRDLIQNGAICRLAGVLGDTVAFRHDRIREELLVRGGVYALQQGCELPDAVLDPYFADIVGNALARRVPSENILQSLVRRSPLSLFMAITILARETKPVPDLICRIARTYFEIEYRNLSIAFTTYDALGNESCHVRWTTEFEDIVGELSEVRSPAMLEITAMALETPSTKPWFYFAVLDGRMANGCIRSAMQVLARDEPSGLDWREYSCGVTYAEILSVREVLSSGLTKVVVSEAMGDWERRGALELAGLLADETLVDSISLCWSAAEDKKAILASCLWASIRCRGEIPSDILNETIAVWAALPSWIDDESVLSREIVAETLFRAIGWNPNEKVVAYLVENCGDSSLLAWPVARLLRQVDLEIARRFVEGIETKTRSVFKSVVESFYPDDSLQDDGAAVVAAAASDPDWWREDKDPYTSDQVFLDGLDWMTNESAFYWDCEGSFNWLDHQREQPERHMNLLRNWFRENRTLAGLRVVGAYLKDFGQRADLALLDGDTIEGPEDEINRICVDVGYAVRRRSLS
jgi:hypothetical protein